MATPTEDINMEEVEEAYSSTRRNEQIDNLVLIVDLLIHEFGVNGGPEGFYGNNIIDLDISNEIAGIFNTMWNMYRKSVNPNNAGNALVVRSFTIGTVTHDSTSLLTKIKALGFAKPIDLKICQPLVDMLTAFKMVYDECRVSTAKFSVREDGKKVDKSLSNYGLSNVHLPVLTGATYKPERRTGLMHSLGPITLAILLANERRYFDKVEKAFKDSVRFLPCVDELADVLKSAKNATEVRSILPILGNLLLITGSRSANKIYYPLFYFLKAWRIEEGRSMDFSGVRGIAIYNAFKSKFVWQKKSKGSTDEVSQIVFHGMFGTSLEDLGVLSSVTTCKNWKKRSELTEAYKVVRSDPSKKFTPIGFTYISKGASACMMKAGSTNKPQLSSKIVFAGIRNKTYTSAFQRYLETGINSTVFGRDQLSLCSALTRMTEEYKKLLNSGALSQAGTVKWSVIEDGNIAETDFVPNENGEYPYS